MSEHDETIEFASRLILAESVSPEDAGCQQLIADYLSGLGFEIEHMPFGDVSNLWATRGQGAPLLVLAGHTDVVPAGPLEAWERPPFSPVIENGVLYGRGAADMKGSLAAMLTGVRRFVEEQPDHPGTLAFLITSDEESDAVDGTRKVIDELSRRGIQIDWCLIGEPSSASELGDVIRIGRRGSLNGTLRVLGTQGHVAYPDEADNPIHRSLAALAELVDVSWDEGNEHFPPTSLQISNIHGGTGANNVIPGKLELLFNFRFSTESSAETLKSRTHEILDRYDIEYEIDWALSGDPFLTGEGTLIAAVQDSLEHILGVKTHLSTSGGTSDGRFISPAGAEVVELGPCNETIHKVNECTSTDDLVRLSEVYTDVLKRLLPSP